MRVVPPGLERWRRPLEKLAHRARPQLLARPLRLGAKLQSLEPASPLAIALLAAIALHLLTLSALQLRQRRQPAAVVPTVRDDTPELLLFSRQQSRESALAPLSVAALAQLPPPPPPPPLAPTAGRSQTPAPSATASAAVPGRKRLAMSVTRRQPSPSKGSSARPGRSPSLPSGSAPVDPALSSALAAVQRWQAGPTAQPPGGDSGWPAPQKAEAEQSALWKRLWDKAIPAGSVPGVPRTLPPAVELRRLAAGDEDAATLPESRRLSLLVGERLLLIWPAGGRLWLLQSAASPSESDGATPSAGR